MQNTVSKTVALAGLFLCMLVFGGAFSGITTPVHAVHADEVDTEEELKQFVEEAIDEYYINTIIKTCDFSDAPFGPLIAQQGIDLATATVDEIKGYIPLFSLVGLTSRSDIEPYCDFSQRFDQVFGREDGDWKSGSIYLFVIDDQGKFLFHGADQSVEETVLTAVDEGGMNVRELIVDEAETPMNNGIVHYCWDDPAVDSDNIDDNDPATAPGDSWKVSYVVDPFVYLEAPALSPSPGVIFGSGIYPKAGNPPSGCDGDGMANGGGDMDEMDDMQEPVEEPMDEPEDVVEEAMDDVGDSISGGGCAVAAGSDSTPRNDALNLLLIVSALFFAVSFGNRAVRRRNGIRS